VNQPQPAAEQMLSDAKLKLGEVTTQDTNDRNQVGKVLASTPAGGATVNEGTTVNLVVGRAPDTVAVPPVVNLTVDQARTTLKNAGFTSINTEQVDSTETKGRVTAVDPAEGTTIDPSTPITLSVSTGTVKLPDVKGQTEQEARAALTDAGISAGQITTTQVERADVAPGTVVDTNPGAASAVGVDDTITLQIAAAPTEITVPNVAGKPEPAARQILQNAGFTKITRVDSDGDGKQTAGTVVGTDPGAGSKAKAGDEIVLLVVGGG
jgi:serine/threonine-protein kinase